MSAPAHRRHPRRTNRPTFEVMLMYNPLTVDLAALRRRDLLDDAALSRDRRVAREALLTGVRRSRARRALARRVLL